jgi:ubiquinol-cytochrome c reductase iron-sulfur subunit
VANSSTVEPTRRDMLFIATGAAAAVGTAATIWPFVSQMSPDAATIAAGAPVEVDLAAIPEGAIVTIKWRGNPIFVRHRTKGEIEAARKDDTARLPDPQPDAARVQKPEWLVVVGVCTHLGCVPLGQTGNARPLRWLVLPVPWLGLRYFRPHSPGPRRPICWCRSMLSLPIRSCASVDRLPARSGRAPRRQPRCQNS